MQNDVIDPKYLVTKIEKISTPKGLPGDDWYRYVIKKGKSVMECKKSGSLKTVTEHANNAAEQINARNVRGCQKKK
jgi:hypothetical protein